MTHREKLYNPNEPADSYNANNPMAMEALYVKRKGNSRDSAALDPKHTHFLLVDNGKDEWGGEIDTRASLMARVSELFKVAY